MDEPLVPAPRPGPIVTSDPWHSLRALTPARIGLGRAGHALPTRERLACDAAHARARAAVHVPLDVNAVCRGLAPLVPGDTPLVLASAAPDRASYLLRPDLGRRLAVESRRRLEQHAGLEPGADLALVVADGLSTTAVTRHAIPLVAAILALRPVDWRVGPIVVVRQARVAIGDEIGAVLRARHVAVLIGERPGMSCQDSLGIYITGDPRPGRTDAERNCLSNIHPGGLATDAAAIRFWWLLAAARRIGMTGVALKDRSTSVPARDAGDALTWSIV